MELPLPVSRPAFGRVPQTSRDSPCAVVGLARISSVPAFSGFAASPSRRRAVTDRSRSPPGSSLVRPNPCEESRNILAPGVLRVCPRDLLRCRLQRSGGHRRAVSSWPGEPPFLAGTRRSPAFRRKSFPVLQRREDTVEWTRADCVARQAHRPARKPSVRGALGGARPRCWLGVPARQRSPVAAKAPPTLGSASRRHGDGLPRTVPSSHARPPPAPLAEAARGLPPEGGTPTGCARPGRGRGGTGLRSVATSEHWMQSCYAPGQ